MQELLWRVGGASVLNLAEEEGAVNKYIKGYLNFQKLHLYVSGAALGLCKQQIN